MNNAGGATLPTVREVLSEPILDALLDGTSDIVLVLDEDCRCVRASRRALGLLGYAEDSQPNLAGLLVDSARDTTLAHASAAMPADRYEALGRVLRHEDGHAVPVQLDVWRVDSGGRTFSVCIARDASARPPADDAHHRQVMASNGLMPAGPAQGATPINLQSNFAMAVSHELRTPLTTILGSAESLLSAWMQLDNMARRKSVERLLSGARRLDLLVRDLLVVLGIEEGTLAVIPVCTPLAPLLEQALYDASAVHPNLDVRARGLRHAPVIWADPERVVQVLVHLLDNAARHGQGAGPPEVRVETTAAEVTIRVTDRGPGLPVAGRERLFTRFGKLSPASHAGRVGIGLGLYISRRLVESMGGAINVDSTPGKGASFWFTLPLAGRGVVDGP